MKIVIDRRVQNKSSVTWPLTRSQSHARRTSVELRPNSTLTARYGKGQRSGGSAKRPREALGPRGDTQSRPPAALDRCTGVTGAVACRDAWPACRNTNSQARGTIPDPIIWDHDREGVNESVLCLQLWSVRASTSEVRCIQHSSFQLSSSLEFLTRSDAEGGVRRCVSGV